MEKNSEPIDKNIFGDAFPRARTTCGEILPDGTIIDLVMSKEEERLHLIRWNGTESLITPHILFDNVIYHVPDLHPSVRQDVPFPTGAADYGADRELLAELSQPFLDLCCSASQAGLAVCFGIATWFADVSLSPPELVLTGPDMGQAILLLQRLRTICRRAVILSDISRADFRRLPMELKPTLLLNEPDVSVKVRRFWEASNFRILRVPGNGGALQSVACSKAVFIGMDGGSDSWGQQAAHLALPPKHSRVRPLEPTEEARITEYFQPRMQMFRFRHLQAMRESGSAACKGKLHGSGLARQLFAYLGDAPDIIEAVTPLLQSQEQDALARRSCDPALALAEVIWTVLHDGQKEATITRITELTNALVRSRGETLDHSPEELGWKLRNLGLYRKRGRNGMVLRFDSQTVRRVHELSRQLALKVQPVARCRDCTELEGTGG